MINRHQPGPTLSEQIRQVHGRLEQELAELNTLSLQQLDSQLGRMMALCRREIERRARLAARGAERRNGR